MKQKLDLYEWNNTPRTTYEYPCLAKVNGFVNQKEGDEVYDYFFPHIRVILAENIYEDFGVCYVDSEGERWLSIYDLVDLTILKGNNK
jgi:hypothetical protein